MNLFRSDYRPGVEAYPIEVPPIASGPTYYFRSESGLRYQVMFARKKDHYLHHIVNFSVLDDDYDNEYAETNRGEVYRVIATVAEIIRLYHEANPSSRSYEFSGEFKAGNEDRKTSIRSLLYYRKAKEILDPNWQILIRDNRVVVSL